MIKNIQIDSDEINLVELIQIIWKGKWRIIAVTVIMVILVFGYETSQTKNFEATTAVEPINISEESRYISLYELYNQMNSESTENYNENEISNMNMKDRQSFSLQTFQISRNGLHSFFIEILKEKSLFEEAIRKNNLLNVSKYSSEEKYNEAVTKLASKIKIVTTVLPSETEFGPEISFTEIKFLYHNAQAWTNVLRYVSENANKVVKKKLHDHFDRLLLVKKIKRDNRLEDYEQKIKNLIDDYDRVTFDEILYLKEQSEIARKLGIAKNTIEVLTFGSQNALLSNVNTDSPFYLRGYEAIEKEISLITSRINKKAFIEGLYETEKEIRSIKQDKFLERMASDIELTPLADNQNFTASSIKFLTTQYKHENKIKKLLFAMLIGLIIGLFIVLIAHSLESSKTVRNN